MTSNRQFDSYVEMALLFVLGVLGGVALKIEAGKMITIGYDDYKMKFSNNQYNINNLQKKINEALVTQEKNESAQSEEVGEQDLQDGSQGTSSQEYISQ